MDGGAHPHGVQSGGQPARAVVAGAPARPGTVATCCGPHSFWLSTPTPARYLAENGGCESTNLAVTTPCIIDFRSALSPPRGQHFSPISNPPQFCPGLFRHVECKPDARCQADSGATTLSSFRLALFAARRPGLHVLLTRRPGGQLTHLRPAPSTQPAVLTKRLHLPGNHSQGLEPAAAAKQLPCLQESATSGPGASSVPCRCGRGR